MSEAVKKPKAWYVYIIRTQRDQLYTGITTDVERRFNEHLSGEKGARFFRRSPPVEICFVEEKTNRSEASKREAEIKKMSRKSKDLLIKGLS